MDTNIRRYVPYVYLQRKHEDHYVIFICIPCYENQTIKLLGDKKPLYPHGTTIINLGISGEEPDQHDAPLAYYHTYETLKPCSEYGESYNPESFGIEVNTIYDLEYPDSEEVDSKCHTTKVLYGHADEQDVTIENKIALQSPYLYLNNPTAGMGNNNQYLPACLLFLKNHVLESTSCQNGNGVFKQMLYLRESNTEEMGMINPIEIPSNSYEYFETGEVKGHFETTVYMDSSDQSDPKEEKTGILRNISADIDSMGSIFNHK